MTVSSEDVGYILGLPVFGEAVTCGHIENRKECKIPYSVKVRTLKRISKYARE